MFDQIIFMLYVCYQMFYLIHDKPNSSKQNSNNKNYTIIQKGKLYRQFNKILSKLYDYNIFNFF